MKSPNIHTPNVIKYTYYSYDSYRPYYKGGPIGMGTRATDRDGDKKHNTKKNTPQTPPNETVTPREQIEFALSKPCQRHFVAERLITI